MAMRRVCEGGEGVVNGLRPFGLNMYRLTDPDGPYRLGYKTYLQKRHILPKDHCDGGPALCGFDLGDWILGAAYEATERKLCGRCAAVARKERSSWVIR